MEARERAKANGMEPATGYDTQLGGYQFPGLTKREEFAKAAMQGILASPKFTKPELREQIEATGTGAIQIVAMSAVDLADALLLALETEEKR